MGRRTKFGGAAVILGVALFLIANQQVQEAQTVSGQVQRAISEETQNQYQMYSMVRVIGAILAIGGGLAVGSEYLGSSQTATATGSTSVQSTDTAGPDSSTQGGFTHWAIGFRPGAKRRNIVVGFLYFLSAWMGFGSVASGFPFLLALSFLGLPIALLLIGYITNAGTSEMSQPQEVETQASAHSHSVDSPSQSTAGQTAEASQHESNHPDISEEAATDDPLEKLERLHELKEQGALSEAEFEEKKAELLDET